MPTKPQLTTARDVKTPSTKDKYGQQELPHATVVEQKVNVNGLYKWFVNSLLNVATSGVVAQSLEPEVCDQYAR